MLQCEVYLLTTLRLRDPSVVCCRAVLVSAKFALPQPLLLLRVWAYRQRCHELCWHVLAGASFPDVAVPPALLATSLCPTTVAKHVGHVVWALCSLPFMDGHPPDTGARLLLLDQAWASPNPHSLARPPQLQLELNGTFRHPRNRDKPGGVTSGPGEPLCLPCTVRSCCHVSSPTSGTLQPQCPYTL